MSALDVLWRYDRIILPALAFVVGFVVANPAVSESAKTSLLESTTHQEEQNAQFEKAFQEQINELSQQLKDEQERYTELESENGNLGDIVSEFSVDEDADGLSNYTEELIGTDPKNQDTDGDGFHDLAEIQNGYSPIEKPAVSTESAKAVLSITDTPPPVVTDTAPVQCKIKADANNTYYLPGSKHYNEITAIDRWFCSLDEALAAGYKPPLK